MSNKVLIDEDNLNNIALAIQSKSGSSEKVTPSEMAQAISGIQTGDNVIFLTTSDNSRLITTKGNHYAVKPAYAMATLLNDSNNVITTRANLYNTFIIIVKVCLTASESGVRFVLGWAQSGYYGVMPEMTVNNAVYVGVGAETGTLNLNEWYYLSYINNKVTGKTNYYLFTENGTLQSQKEKNTTATGSNSSYLILGGCYGASNEMLKSAMIDGDEILIKGDDTVLFGHYVSPTMQSILDTITS